MTWVSEIGKRPSSPAGVPEHGLEALHNFLSAEVLRGVLGALGDRFLERRGG